MPSFSVLCSVAMLVLGTVIAGGEQGPPQFCFGGEKHCLNIVNDVGLINSLGD